MKFGIGIITTGNREIHPGVLNHLTMPTTIHIHLDTERRGPAYGRNECIKALYDIGCDYITLLDDDTFPIKNGWQDYLVKTTEKNKIHVLGYPDPTVATKTAYAEGMDWWQFCTGCFTFITRHAVQTIGYYNPEFKTYGHEDIEYLYRARETGLNGFLGGDASPAQIAEYIHSEDIYGVHDRSFDPTANMSAAAKQESIRINQDVFEKAIYQTRQMYRPYIN